MKIVKYDNNEEAHLAVYLSGRDRLRKETDREYANITIATIILLLSMHEVCSFIRETKNVGWFLSPFCILSATSIAKWSCSVCRHSPTERRNSSWFIRTISLNSYGFVLRNSNGRKNLSYRLNSVLQTLDAQRTHIQCQNSSSC
jgi:hypothetical protein